MRVSASGIPKGPACFRSLRGTQRSAIVRSDTCSSFVHKLVAFAKIFVAERSEVSSSKASSLDALRIGRPVLSELELVLVSYSISLATAFASCSSRTAFR